MRQGIAGKEPHGKSITDETFEEAGKSQGMSKKQAMEETYKMLKKVLGK
jgi:hypothetical protein